MIARDEAQVRELDAEIIDSMKDDAWHGQRRSRSSRSTPFPTVRPPRPAFLERRARTMDYVRDTEDPLR